MAAREAYSRRGVRGHVWAPQMKVRRPDLSLALRGTAVEGANEADGPFSSL